MSTHDCLIFEGTVLEAHRGQYTVDCTAGALRRRVVAKGNGLRLVAGDHVEVTVSRFALSRGRIVRRLESIERPAPQNRQPSEAS